MIKQIRLTDVVRCMGFDRCREKDCDHYNYHAAKKKCTGKRPIHFCRRIDAFVPCGQRGAHHNPYPYRR